MGPGGGVPSCRRLFGHGAKPTDAERFLVIFWKKSCFNAIGSHFALVQSHLKELDFQHLKAN